MNTSSLPFFLCVGLLCACDLPGSEDSDSGANSTTGAETGEALGDDDDDDAESGSDTGDADGDDDDDDNADDTGGDTDEPPAVDSPSCEGLTTQCAGESCCTKLAVPGGSMQLGRGETGNDACPPSGEISCSGWETPELEISVDPFVLDKYPVTVGRFRQFVDAWDNENWRPSPGEGAHPAIDGSGWDSSWSDLLPGALTDGLFCQSWTQWSDEPENREDFPIGCVNWYHAQAFCIWDGGRLPTEAEFEFAAAGGDEDRLYPWGGATPDESRAVFYDVNFVTSPVGSAPEGAGRWGHLDLAGNLAEWSFDCFEEEFYGSLQADVANPASVPASGASPCQSDGTWDDIHTLRSNGGEDHDDLRSSSRSYMGGSDAFASIGLRCAYNE